MHTRSPAEISFVRAFGYYLRGSHASVRLLANRQSLGRECQRDQSIYCGGAHNFGRLRHERMRSASQERQRVARNGQGRHRASRAPVSGKM
ncbi:MAG: hypothetical protein EON55_21760 [Alphaproteobacteria bacterium]|nr:MAG: hypothetical protein EON55_21760 [Alphaproteobacteria bacterium]